MSEKKTKDFKKDLQTWKPQRNQSKEKILTWLYGRNDLRIILKKIAKTSYLIEELTSELFLWLCNKPENDLQKLYQNQVIDFTILEWINRQWKSSTSPFYNKIRRFELGKGISEEQKVKVIQALYSDKDNEMKEVFAASLDRAIEELRSPGEYTYYHRDIIQNYLKLKTAKAVALKLNIRPEYISQALADAKAMLKEKISADVNQYLENQLNNFKNSINI